MSAKIEILEYISEPKNFKLGKVDFKVIYNADKWEIFRNVGFFQKGTNKWLGISNVQRNDKWLATYERAPSTKAVFDQALKALEEKLAKDSFNGDRINNEYKPDDNEPIPF